MKRCSFVKAVGGDPEHPTDLSLMSNTKKFCDRGTGDRIRKGSAGKLPALPGSNAFDSFLLRQPQNNITRRSAVCRASTDRVADTSIAASLLRSGKIPYKNKWSSRARDRPLGLQMVSPLVFV